MPGPARLLPAALIALLFCTPVAADIPRPLDERATVRLMVAAIAAALPEMKVEASTTGAAVVVRSPDKRRRTLWVEDIHAALRAEPDGARREELLASHVAEEVATLNGLATGKQKLVLDALGEIETETLLPILHVPDPGASWELPTNAHLRFTGGMVVFWVQDREIAGIRPGPLTAREVRAAGFDKMELRRIGLANLEARLDCVTERRDGRFVTLSLDGRFGSSLLLLSGYWEQRAQGGQVLTTAIPRKDELIVIEGATAAEIADLRRRAAASHAAAGPADDRLSPELLRWTGADWQVLPP